MFDPIKELILILLKKKNLFFKVFLSLSALSLLYVLFLRVPNYTSNAKIFINSKSQSLNQTSFLGGILGSQTGGARDVQILNEIIRGNSFFFRLMNSDIVIDKDNQFTFKEILVNDMNTANYQKLYNEFLKKRLNITYDSKKQIIDIGIKSKSREIAKNLTILALDEIENSYVQYKEGLEKNKLESFNSRIAEVNQQLIKVETRLTEFRENNINFQSSPTLLMEYERLMRDRLIKEETIITLTGQKELSELELKSNKDLFLILNEPYLPIYKDKPTNKILFIMLSFLSLLLAVTAVIIINEKDLKREN